MVEVQVGGGVASGMRAHTPVPLDDPDLHVLRDVAAVFGFPRPLSQHPQRSIVAAVDGAGDRVELLLDSLHPLPLVAGLSLGRCPHQSQHVIDEVVVGRALQTLPACHDLVPALGPRRGVDLAQVQPVAPPLPADAQLHRLQQRELAYQRQPEGGETVGVARGVAEQRRAVRVHDEVP